jgi:hypothetical protein
MKNKLILLAVGMAAILALPVQAQTSPTSVTSSNSPSVTGGLQEIYAAVSGSGVLKATNYSFEPYATYAPKLSGASAKAGGGLLAIYNLNNYAGLGLGVDYLGQFSLVSANATLQYPTHPLTFTGWSWATNLAVTPFALAGVGTPLSGANGSAASIEDAGGYIQFGHLWGGEFNTGVAYGQWNNAGDYSGKRYHIFLGWSKGF